MAVDIDLQALTQADLDQLWEDVDVERQRRLHETTIPATIEDLNQKYLNAIGRADGSEWVQPTGAFDAYPLDYTVTHNSKTWKSLVAANVWEPGVANWSEVVPEGSGPAEWVQPTGATDAYAKGATVTHNGQTWTSDVDANVWEPGVYGWTAVAV